MKLETSDTEGEGVANSLQFTKDLFNELLLNPQQKYPLEDELTTERSRRSTFHPWKRDQETQAPPPRATSLFLVTTGATLPGRAGMGAPAADRPLRHPPAWPCWSCPCWQGDPHPQRPWERNKGASRLSAAAPWCPAGAAQDGGEGGDRWGGGRPARPPRRPPASSPPGWAPEQVPRPGPGAPALPHALGQPTCAGLQEQPERGQVPRQQGEEARGHAVARRPH